MLVRRAMGVLFISVVFAACGGDGGSNPPAEDVQTGGDDLALDASETQGPTELTVKVDVDIAQGNAPLKVHFKCDVTGAEPSELTYQWKIGDKPASLPELDWTFYEKGDYQACCSVLRKNGQGNQVKECANVQVEGTAAIAITRPVVGGASELAPGQCFDLTFTVTNKGDIIDTPFDIACVLSPNQEWDVEPAKHIALKSWSLPGMGDGTHVTAELKYEGEEICLDQGVPDHPAYFLLCKADSADAVHELNEDDNAQFATTFITVDHTLLLDPDLVITSLEVPKDQAFPKSWGDKLSYALTIENLGEADSTKFEYEVYVCQGKVKDDTCVPISAGLGTTVFQLAAGSAVPPVSRTWTVPDDFADGTYCVLGVVDVENQVDESDELNNVTVAADCFEVKYSEKEGIDLAITSLKCAPTGAVWNGSLAIEMEVTNNGNVPTPLWEYEFWLGPNSAPGTGDTKFCKDPTSAGCTLATPDAKCCTQNAAILPGETVKISHAGVVPPEQPLKEYNCIAKVDSANDITETDEANNLAVYEKKITVQSKAYTDVSVSNVTFNPDTVEAGEEIKVSFDAGNTQTSSVAGATFCIVLSKDKTINVSELKSGKDISIGEQAVLEIEPGQSLHFTEKLIVPLALDHTVGSYYVGVVADCKSVLTNDTQPNNNHANAQQGTLTVLNPMGGCFEDAFEPNSTEKTPTPLAAGLTTGLGSCDDEDWFKITVPETNTLVIDVTAHETLQLKPAAFDIDIELQDPSGKLIDSSAQTGDKDTVLAFVVPATGDYLLRVKGKKSGTLAQYDLDVQLKPPFEGTDLFAVKAKASPSLTFQGGALFLDWKLVNLGKTPAGAFDITVYASKDDVFDGADVKVATLPMAGFDGALAKDRTDKIILPLDIPADAYHALIVVDEANVLDEADETNNVAVTSLFTVNGETPCLDDTLEHNDDAGTATELEPITQSFTELGVCPDLDDWFQMELPFGKRIEAVVTYKYVASAGYVYLQIVDKNGVAVLDEGQKQGKAEILIPYIWDPGRYYLRVYNPKKGGKAAPYVYDLQVEVLEPLPEDACPGDAYETSNDPGHAALVGCGLKEMTLCKQDRDWLTFSLPAASEVQITLTNEGAALKMSVFTDPTSKATVTQSGNGMKTIKSGESPQTYWVLVEPKTATTKVTNTGYTLFLDGIAGVDLAIANVKPATGQAYEGEDEIVGFQVVNQCLDVVPNVNFGLYLSTDDVFSDDDLLVHEAPVGQDVLGKTAVDVFEKFTVPYGTPKGLYSLFVVADPMSEIAESNEKNNTGVAPLLVKEVCVDDDLEPNNVPKLAANVVQGIYGPLQTCPYDLDWYIITLAAGQKVTAAAVFTNADGDLDLRLYGDGAYTVPLVKAFQTLDGETLEFTAPADGDYFLRVDGLSGAANAYTLDVKVE